MSVLSESCSIKEKKRSSSDDSIPNVRPGVAVVGVVEVDAVEDTVAEEGKEDGKATYPCRGMESEW
jgi:hypothetical protein